MDWRSAKPTDIDLPDCWTPLVKAAMTKAARLLWWVIADTRSWNSNCPNERIQLKSENLDLQCDYSVLEQITNILFARMERISPHSRPKYTPKERLTILHIQAIMGWTTARTAKAFLLSPDTISEWSKSLYRDNDMLEMSAPINKYPEFVRLIVSQLKATCPYLGKRKIAEFIARAGLDISASTVGRMLKSPRLPKTPPKSSANKSTSKGRAVSTKRPNGAWHVDYTLVPTRKLGNWVTWPPFSILHRWPFYWWVGVVIDHHSRACLGFTVFEKQPTTEQTTDFLDGIIALQGKPKRIVTDDGPQFKERYGAWCAGYEIEHTKGAVGEHGSIAVVERFILSLKNECTRRLIGCLYSQRVLRTELDHYVTWYNEFRPHTTLKGRVPAEVYQDRTLQTVTLCNPRASPKKLEVDIHHYQGCEHLPIVELREVA